MAPTTEQASDAQRRHELLYNERIIVHPTYGTVRLMRPSPQEELWIAEARQKQYHTDMRTPDVLSHAQLEKIAIERGMWTADMKDRLDELSRKVGEAMIALDAAGFLSLDELGAQYQAISTKLLDAFAEQSEILDAIHRYLDLDATATLADRTAITAAAPSTDIDEWLDEADAVRSQMELLKEFLALRKELDKLQEIQTTIFVDSIESRAQRAENMARLYYCTSKVPEGTRSGDAVKGTPIWPTLQGCYASRAEEIEVLLMEYNYFVNGITDEFKEKLGKYGFIKRQNATSDSSDDSPVLPTSNSDGASVENAPMPSSEAMAS